MRGLTRPAKADILRVNWLCWLRQPELIMQIDSWARPLRLLLVLGACLLLCSRAALNTEFLVYG